MWIIGYLIAWAIGGASLGYGISLLPTSQAFALGFIAFGVATILAGLFVLIVKAPWVAGLRVRGDSDSGITAEVFVIFVGLKDWETVVVIAIYVVTIVVTYLIGYLA
jgi:hypothetical protein